MCRPLWGQFHPFFCQRLIASHKVEWVLQILPSEAFGPQHPQRWCHIQGGKTPEQQNPTAVLLAYHIFITTTSWWQSILLEHGTKDRKIHFHSRAKIAVVIKIYFLFLFEGYCIGNPLLVAHSQQLAVNWAGELIACVDKDTEFWVCECAKEAPNNDNFSVSLMQMV